MVVFGPCRDILYAGSLVGKKEEASWSLLFAMNGTMVLAFCLFFGTRKDRALSTPILFTFWRFSMIGFMGAQPSVDAA